MLFLLSYCVTMDPGKAGSKVGVAKSCVDGGCSLLHEAIEGWLFLFRMDACDAFLLEPTRIPPSSGSDLSGDESQDPSLLLRFRFTRPVSA